MQRRTSSADNPLAFPRPPFTAPMPPHATQRTMCKLYFSVAAIAVVNVAAAAVINVTSLVIVDAAAVAFMSVDAVVVVNNAAVALFLSMMLQYQ